ncbi:hypothetical protein J437_LFUL004294 [Ladona fulva]|uniref:Cuticle protein CPCFC domain-containing protein n=1 Tax=Ladona fulva TaxID=123851 RepID=A0A8K0K1P2_LADFU|nr:hypothetical protein J437_LFUL004294 [Ladona fulva]
MRRDLEGQGSDVSSGSRRRAKAEKELASADGWGRRVWCVCAGSRDTPPPHLFYFAPYAPGPRANIRALYKRTTARANYNHSECSFLRTPSQSNKSPAKMYAKLMLLLVAAAVAVADKYPAGLNPALCPNYPNCDNALIALHSANPSAVTPYWAAPIAKEYPAGVHPAACPNYPYCGTAVPLAYAAWAPYTREWPAGVHPAACPNYPYCH